MRELLSELLDLLTRLEDGKREAANNGADARALAVAATNLQTACLWLEYAL